MSNKINILSAIALIAAPLSAQAVTPGHDMLAKLSGVDSTSYTLSETAQVAAEKGVHRRAGRAAYIAEQKQSVTGHNDGHAMQAKLLGVEGQGFTGAELAQIAAEKGAEDRAARAAYIQAQKSAVTGQNAGHEMLASLLGLEGQGFSGAELAQIGAEDTAEDRAARASFLADR